jgi:enoyl-CoA hydratase/carnithine racemase
MTYNDIIFDLTDHIATITLNRPQAMNALNREMYGELEQALRESHRDREVRCVIITGEGRAFCSGDDVKQIMLGERSTTNGAAERPVRNPKSPPTPAGAALLECDKPVIAAVNGAAVGWGMDLSLMCDIRIASENAKFGELFIKRGLMPDLGGIWRLPQVVGLSKAAELLFTGDVIDAREAERIGLVTKVTAHDDLMAEARTLGAKIAANPPIAMRFIKEGLRKATYGNVADLSEYIHNSLNYLFTTEDHLEGARSFVERREPVFKGR